MQKEKQHKKRGKKGKKREKSKTILSIPEHKQENNNRKKLREKQDKKENQVAAFETMCTVCIGIEEGGRVGGGSLGLLEKTSLILPIIFLLWESLISLFNFQWFSFSIDNLFPLEIGRLKHYFVTKYLFAWFIYFKLDFWKKSLQM